MGLFSKKNDYESVAMEIDASQQRRRERANASTPSASSASAQTNPPRPPAAPSPKINVSMPPPVETAKPTPVSPYGIDEVIQLMRELPDNKKEMVILIVQKTLASAKIDIRTILDKATRKLEGLQSKNDKLKSEIRDLEELIIQKKSDVDRIRRDMEETQAVRQNFEAVHQRTSQKGSHLPPRHFEEEVSTMDERQQTQVLEYSGTLSS